MPEGPAVARGRSVQRRAELVVRAVLAAVAEERTVGADGGAPAAPGVGERRAGLQIGILDQYAERDLGPAPGALHRRQRRFVERERGGDPIFGGGDIIIFALDPPPAATEPLRHRAGGDRKSTRLNSSH